SPAPPGPYTIGGLAGDVLRLLDEFGVFRLTGVSAHQRAGGLLDRGLRQQHGSGGLAERDEAVLARHPDGLAAIAAAGSHRPPPPPPPRRCAGSRRRSAPAR